MNSDHWVHLKQNSKADDVWGGSLLFPGVEAPPTLSQCFLLNEHFLSTETCLGYYLNGNVSPFSHTKELSMFASGQPSVS